MSSLNHRITNPSLYPPRSFQARTPPTSSTQNLRPNAGSAGNNSNSNNGTNRSTTGSTNNALFSRQSLLILTLGVMFGYILLPILLVQQLGFGDLSLPAQRTALKNMDIQMQGVRAIGSLKPANKESVSSNSPSRILYNDDAKLQKKSEALPESKSPETEEQTPPEIPKTAEAKESTGNFEAYVEKVEGKRDAASKAKHETKILRSGEAGYVVKKQFNDAEKRILEDRLILSQQSIPTATSPHIMLTETLPDHQRKKILVTGGAGFVGSHLVDKLMMEGHEVIVVDNFFTGQKKNVAHWLQHPNFRYVSSRSWTLSLASEYVVFLDSSNLPPNLVWSFTTSPNLSS